MEFPNRLFIHNNKWLYEKENRKDEEFNKKINDLIIYLID